MRMSKKYSSFSFSFFSILSLSCFPFSLSLSLSPWIMNDRDECLFLNSISSNPLYLPSSYFSLSSSRGRERKRREKENRGWIEFKRKNDKNQTGKVIKMQMRCREINELFHPFQKIFLTWNFSLSLSLSLTWNFSPFLHLLPVHKLGQFITDLVSRNPCTKRSMKRRTGWSQGKWMVQIVLNQSPNLGQQSCHGTQPTLGVDNGTWEGRRFSSETKRDQKRSNDDDRDTYFSTSPLDSSSVPFLGWLYLHDWPIRVDPISRRKKGRKKEKKGEKKVNKKTDERGKEEEEAKERHMIVWRVGSAICHQVLLPFTFELLIFSDAKNVWKNVRKSALSNVSVSSVCI